MARGNETTTDFKVNISELKKAMQEAKRQVGIVNSEFKAVSSTMDDWTKSTDGISAKLKQLGGNLKLEEKILANYEDQLKLTMEQYPKGGKAVDDLIIKINKQKATINDVKKEINKYEQSLQDLIDGNEGAADSLKDMGDTAKDSGDGFTVLKGAVSEFVGNVLTQLVDSLKDAIGSMMTFSDEADKAMNNFQASTGATAEEMAGFEKTMENIYNANYGESFEDIASAMGEVKRISGDIGADELEKMTTNALTMRDTFDFEVSESMRAVNSLMDQFGITADEAFNLMAQGAQGGLNQNGDLLDVINEYSVHFQRAGYSADDMFNMLSNGVESGTWSVDKLGDAVKEFNIRMSDGSAKESVEALGFSWEGISSAWAEGGEEAKEVFNLLMNELDGLTNETDGYNIGVGLLGTMFEDLGADAVYALSQTEGEITSTKDALAEINAVKYDSVGEALQGIGRNIQTGILMPIGDKLLPIIGDLAAKFKEWLDDPGTQEGIKNLTDSITQFIDNGLSFVKEFIDWFIKNKDGVISALIAIGAGFAVFQVATMISTAVSAFSTFFTLIKSGTTIMKALNLAFGISPIGLIVTAVTALVAVFVYLWNTCEPFKQFWLDLWENIKSAVSTAVEGIGKFFTETIPNFFTGLIGWIKQNWQSILLFLINPFAGLFKYFYDNNGKFKEFVDNAIMFIKQLPTKVWTWLVNTINKVTEWRTNMITKAGEVALAFINKVVEFVKQLPEKIWTWLLNVVTKVATWGISLANKGREAAQKLLTAVVDKIKEIPDKVKSIAGDIVTGLWNGMSDKANWLKEQISGFVGDVTSWLKNFFGIASPSKLMADEVGKWLPEGIAVGITDNAKSTLNAMKDLAVDTVGSARAGLSTASTSLGGRAVAGGVVNNFYQTINAPKQLSRLDIYRQSKNLLGYAGGGF